MNLQPPETSDAFEAMCHQLYSLKWSDPTLTRVGRSGQPQFGVDILGNDGPRAVGIQCKHLVKTKFSLRTIEIEIAKVEKSELAIDLLLFATTALSDARVVREVHELNEKRRKAGKFEVTIDFWGDITGLIQIYPNVGAAFIPGFPTSAILSIEENTLSLLRASQEKKEEDKRLQGEIYIVKESLRRIETTLTIGGAIPPALGNESDPGVTASLDFVRDKINQGHTNDAKLLLSNLGDFQSFRDDYSKFRWLTSNAAIGILTGDTVSASKYYLLAYEFAKDIEKANANRVHAYVLRKDYAIADAACDQALTMFPASDLLYALKVGIGYQLRGEVSLAGVPEDISEGDQVLFTRASIESRRANYEDSIELLKRCLKASPDSLDTKRALLADSIALVSDKYLVSALHGQLSNTIKKLLLDSIRLFEPIEKTLPLLQSDHISLELTNNLAVGLELVGDFDRANWIAKSSLDRHPTSANLLRIRFEYLAERNQIQEIINISDGKIGEFPEAVLGSLAEIAANSGSKLWYDQIRALLQTRDLSPGKERTLQMLDFQVKWTSDDHEGAIEDARAYLTKFPDDALVRIFFANMLRREGDSRGATAEAIRASGFLSDQSATLERHRLAELYYRLGNFKLAAAQYRLLVNDPARNDLTLRLLICLIRTKARCEATALLERMSQSDRDSPEFRRAEANLASQSGDWARAVQVLKVEVCSNPGNADLAVSYAGSMYRAELKSDLADYLKSDPIFRDANVDDEIEFCKFQFDNRLDDLAIRRIFRIFRNNAGNARVAGSFSLQMLQFLHRSDLPDSDTIAPGTYVELRSGSYSRVVAIDYDPDVQNIWPELIGSNDPAAKALIGAKSGDRRTLFHGFVERDFVIESIGQIVMYADGKAHELLKNTANSEGPMWHMSLADSDGNIDSSSLIALGSEKRKRVDSIFELYKKNPIPIGFCARALGTDYVRLILDWPSKIVPLFVDTGEAKEFDNGWALACKIRGGCHCVLDLSALVDLCRTDSFKQAVEFLGPLLVAQSVRDIVVDSIKLAESPLYRESSSLVENEGILTRVEHPKSRAKRYLDLLKDVLRAIDTSCNLTRVLGPPVWSASMEDVGEALDNGTFDSLLLCLERDAVLVADDGSIRGLSKYLGVKNSISVQSVLLSANEFGVISDSNYCSMMSKKIEFGHRFVRVRSLDLVCLAMQCPKKLCPRVQAALQTFSSHGMEMSSAIKVGLEFLSAIALVLPVKLVGGYTLALFDSLVFERPEMRADISGCISFLLQKKFGRGGRRIRKADRRYFGTLLSRNVAVDFQRNAGGSS